ncbi:MAG TPA: TRAP transporter small permease subunit [Modicisalibacter sp.]|nr:TRAP transporter small permease subunit [Modicisalibacter sp.]
MITHPLCGKITMMIIRVAERITAFTDMLAALLTIPLIAALVYEVFSRYVLDNPTFWAYEISYMLMGSIFVLAMGYALKIRQHVSVDLLYGRFSPRGKAVVDVLGYCLFGTAVWWMTVELYASATLAFQNGEVTGKSAWNPVVWPVYTAWFVGFLTLGIQVLAELVKSTVTLFTGKTSETEEKEPGVGL